MVYMNQEKKAEIKKELIKVIPSSWKWSLSVSNCSVIVLTISRGPSELLPKQENNYYRVNEYYLEKSYSGEILIIMKKIVNAMNYGNHDRSDIMTDYFDIGHYVSITIGKWNKPFTYC